MENPLVPQIDYARYLFLLWRRKWLIVFPAVLLPLAVGYYAMTLQDQYRSTTLILVQPQKVPTNFVSTTVTTSIEERVQTISQQIFSRTRLEQIIRELDLFLEEAKKRTPEEIVGLMRSRIDLKVHRNDSFQLAYIDSDPRVSMVVTNKLASLFIEENLKVREQQAIGTGQFLSDEIERYRQLVREREEAVYRFRRQHMDEMPEQLGANQSRLGQLQSELQIITQNMNATEDRRIKLQQSIAEMERKFQDAEGKIGEKRTERSDPMQDDGLNPVFSQVLPIDAQVLKLKEDLDRLRMSFTDKHPEVVRLSAQLHRLEKEAEQQRLLLPREGIIEQLAEIHEPRAVVSGKDYPPAYATFKEDLERTETELMRLKEQYKSIHESTELYQARISAAPARQLQLQQLSDDYDNLKNVLNSLIDKKLQADLAENLERKQKGEQFQILDPANLPQKPFYPNRVRYMFGAFACGLAFGAGLIFMLDFMNFGVKSQQELMSTLELPVLGVIPEIVTEKDLRRKRLWKLGISATCAAAILLGAVVVHVQVKPLPDAFRDLSSRVQATHWTTLRESVREKR